MIRHIDGRSVEILQRKMYGGVLFVRLFGGRAPTEEIYVYRCQLRATGGDEEINKAARAAPLEPQPVYIPESELPPLKGVSDV